MKRWICGFILISLLPTLLFTNSDRACASEALTVQGLVIDHNHTDIKAVPQVWIENAKASLHIYYGHTSHGSQVVSGMTGLVSFANGGGLGLSLPANTFAGLDVVETSPDAGYYPDWVDNTRNYLGTPNSSTGRGTSHPNINVVMWSWCGQLSWMSESQVNTNYLQPMNQLEIDYPGITFIYMTGHSDGSGLTGNLHLRNQQIRHYAEVNHKVLYDFYDIELYDPDGVYYGDKKVNDACEYDSNGDGSLDSNWAMNYQNAHTQNVDWYSCSCAHSEALNCNQKAYAAWWMWAKLAGWGGPAQPEMKPSAYTATLGDEITFTVSLRSLNIAPNTMVTLTDTLPVGLAYVPGSMSASSGSVDDSGSPTLTWGGVMSSTSVVFVTYRASVTATSTQALVNNATVSAAGMDNVQLQTILVVDPLRFFLPILRKP